MSQFNEKLDQARDRHKRLHLAAGLTAPVIFLLIVALLVVSRGTRIEIMPREAKEHADIRVIEGLAFSLVDTVYSLRPQPVIGVSSPGFRDAVQTIDRAFLGKVFPLTLIELPGHLIMEIIGDAADFSDTAWRITGRDAVVGEKLNVQLDVGTYTVLIDNPSFQQKEVAVTIKRGEETRKQVELQPVAEMAQPEIPAVIEAVAFKKPLDRSVVKTVPPRRDTVQKISSAPQDEYQAPPRAAPREYTGHGGIKLKLFVVEDDFTMGAPRSEKGMRANEFLRKTRLTRPFYAGLYEITTGQFAQFKPGKEGGSTGSPITSVSWQEAAAFCNWLSAKEKLNSFYTIAGGRVTGFDENADGYRLLSEAEWEWLARKAGKERQTLFTWGDATVIPPRATNVADESAQGQVRFYVPKYRDGFSGVAPVGSFTRELSGLYDMAGNVSEWVHDVYSLLPPPGTTALNPLGAQAGNAYVIKGANWRSGTITTLRPAFREGLTAGRDDVGFRIGRYLAADAIVMGEKGGR
jgi:formylglycine-generating enzyme required for sulfatase activity